jgi:hypothetical protein
MEHSLEVKTLLQNAVDVLFKAKKIDSEVMVKAQNLGLQGEKRRLRYESAKNHNLINYLKCDAFDSYGITLLGEMPNISSPNTNSMQGFFQMYLQIMEEQYDKLHSIANNLVQVNAQCYAKLLYKKCHCLLEDIKYYRRIIREGDATSWKPEFIFLHQTTKCNVHDEFEEKEKEVGYDF